MKDQTVFKRLEIKFKLTSSQYEKLKELMKNEMIADAHGKSTIYSLYLDTPDFLLARRSMEHPKYKEKLRLRSYGTADEDTKCFVEIKKKYDGIVYKRRVSMKEKYIDSFINNRIFPPDFDSFHDTQVSKEILFMKERYKDLSPKVLLTYEREAFYARDDYNFRITFDQNILFRDTDLKLTVKPNGERIIPEGIILMEVKTAATLPKWLVDYLSANKIYTSGFSKYGTAYRIISGRKTCEAVTAESNKIVPEAGI